MRHFSRQACSRYTDLLYYNSSINQVQLYSQTQNTGGMNIKPLIFTHDKDESASSLDHVISLGHIQQYSSNTQPQNINSEFYTNSSY